MLIHVVALKFSYMCGRHWGFFFFAAADGGDAGRTVRVENKVLSAWMKPTLHNVVCMCVFVVAKLGEKNKSGLVGWSLSVDGCCMKEEDVPFR